MSLRRLVAEYQLLRATRKLQQALNLVAKYGKPGDNATQEHRNAYMVFMQSMIVVSAANLKINTNAET